MMNTQTNITIFRLSRVFGALVLGGLLSSCAMIEVQEIKDKEQLLATAGFKMKLADTPAKMVNLKAMPQHKLVSYQKDGTVYYIYADATTCQCFYLGQDQSYQSFLQLQEQQNIANEDRLKAEMKNEQYENWDTMENWDTIGY
ncbi:MAG: hypothetical protein PHF31_06105 [Methylobacter sp.]|nr:hypothetical protein [Methylobacter sp.]